MECPNYNLLESFLFDVMWKAKFGDPTMTINKLLCHPRNQNVYDALVKIVSDPYNIIDCQFAKIMFRIVIELRNKQETFGDYCEWRDIKNILFSTWATFLDENPSDVYYIRIEGLPGITWEDIQPLNESAYMETYWYSPKVTAYIMLHDLDVEWPGVHCIYHNGLWLYFDYTGIIKVDDVTIIMDRVRDYCIEMMGQESGLIVMNPEDTRICFNR